uniref:Putative radical SAM superfamily protein n=1 Tax=viral metagenome TaxID=1070528 RepID=A0A6H1ZPX6_9ZZZZ
MVAAIFKEQGWGVRCEVSTFRKPLETADFMRIAREYKPDIVGISIITMQVLKIYDLIRQLKQEGFKVIAGGTHATSCSTEAVENGADIAIRNEGEATLREILQGKPLREVLGITYRDVFRHEIVIMGYRPRITDLSTLPDPDFSGFDIEQFRDGGLVKGISRVFTSRGCPGKCTYCDYRVFGQKVALKPIDALIADLQKRVDLYGVRNFIVDDDCFTVNRKHVQAFCEGIKKIRPKVVWQSETRADMMTPELAKMMKDAGCYLVMLGLESGDPETLFRTRKGITLEQNIASVKIAHAAGLQVGVYLMFGFPWQTVDSLDNDLKMIHELWDHTHMFNGSGAVIPFPGTELYSQYVDQCGFKDYWLDPKYQDCGVSLYQNAVNPYAVSTLSQRYMYDDSYIQEQYFFNYSPKFLKKMSEVAYEVGRHNLQTMYPGKFIKHKAIISACKLSRAMYQKFPNFEKRLGSLFAGPKRPKIEDQRNISRGLK